MCDVTRRLKALKQGPSHKQYFKDTQSDPICQTKSPVVFRANHPVLVNSLISLFPKSFKKRQWNSIIEEELLKVVLGV